MASSLPDKKSDKSIAYKVIEVCCMAVCYAYAKCARRVSDHVALVVPGKTLNCLKPEDP